MSTSSYDDRSKTQSILLIRLSAIGDVVMASGVLQALRRVYPQAALDWMIQPECRPLLLGQPDLRDVISFPRKQWSSLVLKGRYFSLTEQGLKLVRRLRSRHYDMILDMQGLFKSGLLSWLAGGKTRIGLNSKEFSRIFMNRIFSSDRQDERIGSEYRALLRELGIDPEPYALGIIPQLDDRRTAQEVIRGTCGEKRVVVLCPFTTRDQKHWPVKNWIQLGRDLRRRTALQPILLGGPGDVSRAEQMVRLSGGAINSLVGRTSLLQSLAVIQESAGVVGVDTGLTHMAVLSEVPTVALFGATRPYLETGSQRSVVLYEPFPCSPCRRRPVCSGQFPCMQALNPGRVLSSVIDLL